MKQEFHEYRTSNAMDWDSMLSLVRRLYCDGDYRMSLLIGCGCFFGLRISDLLTLTWSQLLNDEKVTIYEKKTNKRRVVKTFKNILKTVTMPCIFPMKMKSVSSIAKRWYIAPNVSIILFKEIKQRYNLKIEHFSTHTMRKTFGRKVFESAGTDAPLALMRLQTLFNHASLTITNRYLGITDSELESCYDLLYF